MGGSDAFFQTVVDALATFLPDGLTDPHHRIMWSGVKVWYGDEHRIHYECQFLARPDGGPGPALEIGWHAEHPDPTRNAAALAALQRQERAWRKVIGRDAEAGPFLGSRADTWTRISEIWLGDEVLDPDAAIDAASCLADYIAALQPLLAADPALLAAR